VKQSFLDKHFDVLFLSFFIGSLTLVFVGIPVANWYAAGVEQQAINSQCKTNYTQLQVLLSGDTLKQLCQIKEQQVTVK
jgi:hypothetical protein